MISRTQFIARYVEKLPRIYTTSKPEEWADQNTAITLKTSWPYVVRVTNFTAIKNNTWTF